MSQENVELFYRSVEAFNRRDLDAVLALMDDDVEIASRIVVIEGGWWQNWLDTWPDYKVEVLEVRDIGDVTFAALRNLGHGAGSQVSFEDTIWRLDQWRAGKCISWRIFTNRAEALEAVGLSEQDAHAGS
jgi:hypothetical protein